ncbi:MAG: hypothetical protein IIA12_03710, partial [Proteobacteria bacterium]|nr:hypothetical protein [Pseudomonadota bacterium]
MKSKMGVALIVAAFVVGPLATAEETLVDYLVMACETDIENYCSQDTPGH